MLGSMLSAVPPLLVAAAIGSWSGVVVANPATHSCRRIKLPDSTHEQVVFAGNRVAFQTGKYTFKYGKVGGRVWREARSPRPITTLTADGSTFAYVSGGRIHIFERGTITPKLPRGAQVIDLAFHGRDVALGATWGNGRAGTPKAGLFVISGGVTRLVEREPRSE